MKKTIVSHSIIAAALLGLTGLAVADDKMKSDSSGATSTQSDSAGAAGPKSGAMKDCPPGTPQPTDANPPGPAK